MHGEKMHDAVLLFLSQIHLVKPLKLFSEQGTKQQVSTYYHSFITIIQSHCSKNIPYASFQDEKIHDKTFLFVFNIELSVLKWGWLKMV